VRAYCTSSPSPTGTSIVPVKAGVAIVSVGTQKRSLKSSIVMSYNKDMEDEIDFELEDIADQAREVGKLTPREYAKLNGMAPQLVYYYIRTKKLELEYCLCGRRVLDVNTADKFFESRRQDKGIVRTEADD
jgi:hypothetical protein